MNDFELILADPHLSDEAGHHFEYLNAVARFFSKKNIKTYMVGNRNISKSIEGKIVPIFSSELKPTKLKFNFFHSLKLFFTGHATRSISENNLNQFIFDFCLDIAKIIIHSEKSGCTRKVVFFDSFKAEHIYALMNFISIYKPGPNIFFVVVLHYSPRDKTGDARDPLYIDLASKFINDNFKNKIMFFADTNELSDEYSKLLNIDVPVLPIPHTFEKIINNSNIDDTKIVISFLGSARRQKGYQYSASLVRYLRAKENKFGKRLFFNVQTNLVGKAGSRHKRLCSELSRLRVNMIDKPLSRHKYIEILNDTDIVSLPYSIPPYDLQSSGIFAEALYLGKVCIVPKGTWMAAELRILGIFDGVIYDPENRDGLSQAVEYAIEHWSEVSEKFSVASSYWRKTHNIENFCRILIDRIYKNFHTAYGSLDIDYE